jgi:hypothetical protein
MNLHSVICLIPVYNDWESLSFLIRDIEGLALENKSYVFSIVAVNDGSSEIMPASIHSDKISIEVVDLKLNIGHQRAIAVGLQYILNKKIVGFEEPDLKGHVLVLDGDGEDKPTDILPMVEKAQNKIVFAQRVKRSEGNSFKIGYFFYKLIFKLLTGKSINFGNFSAIPFSLLSKVVILPSLWNHYAGSITESKIPQGVHPTERGTRYFGKSKMNLSSLIIHGFSSISIYFDILCFRVLRFAFISMVFCSIGIGYILFQKLFTDNAIPGWASSLILIVLSIVIQLFSVTFIILLLQLRSRKEIVAPNDSLYLSFIKSK